MIDGERILWRDDESTCFGCSDRNDRGLHLEFFRVGPREVACELVAGDWMNGAPGAIRTPSSM